MQTVGISTVIINIFFCLSAIADESTKRIASLVARQKSRSKPQHSKHNLNFSLPSTFCSQVPLHPQHSLNLPRHGGGPPILPPVIKSELKEMLRFSPVLLSDFDKAFAQHFGRKFEFVRYGFFSMFEVLNAASDIIQIVQTRAGSLLTLKEHPLTKQPEMSECKTVFVYIQLKCECLYSTGIYLSHFAYKDFENCWKIYTVVIEAVVVFYLLRVCTVFEMINTSTFGCTWRRNSNRIAQCFFS